MNKTTFSLAAILTLAAAVHATEFHVTITGKDSNAGSKRAPFRTIQRAADAAQPGDTITVHAGVYRERVNPPRGGTSDAKRITYQAAPGERVVITGSEIVKGWEKVQNDTWKLTLPNSFFGSFNPFHDLIHGDWFTSHGRPHHTGAVYVNGHWLTESAKLDDVLKAAGEKPLWYTDDVGDAGAGDYLLNIASITVGTQRVAADAFSSKGGELHAAPCSEGGNCVGWIRSGSWLKFDNVDLGAETKELEVRVASQTSGGDIEFRADGPSGELLGTRHVPGTGDWQKWTSLKAAIKPASGAKALCLVFKSAPAISPANTIIWAQFKDVNPNDQGIEINARQTVFYPDQPGRNFITVRGFTMENAAPPWAPPTAEQMGLIGTHWSKGWIIENNVIRYSRCSGVALGKYGDQWDNRAESAEGYVGTLTRALTNGWNKATVGGHLVRNNHISHCEQTGIVGSLGCSFSTVTGNEIHDCHVIRLFSGAEQAAIKFHGAIDVVISHNHIYHNGSFGIWLDWMGQGATVTGNLLHDNLAPDMFLEMQHGPILIANNILLSRGRSFSFNSQGMAVAHNLILGPIESYRSDTRETPFHPPHTTTVAGLYPAAKGDSGDHRFYNNLCVAPCNLHVLDKAVLPCFAAGNVFAKGAQPSKFDADALLKPDFDAGVKLTQKPDGWYLELAQDQAWRTEVKRKLVTTDLLGKAKVPDCAYENADGSPLKINTDYFGRKRSEANPFPGPFEIPGDGKQSLKVWPLNP